MPFDSFTEITLVITATVLVTSITRYFKQPLIIGYILTGLLLSPNILGLITDTHSLETFSQIGITILLFTVGIHLDPKVIKDVGKVSLVTGLGQIIFTSFIGFFIAKGFGFETVTSVYIAIALTFSSTIIITKLITDRGDSEKLYGKIAIGFLIVQDIVAALILMGVSAFSTDVATNLTIYTATVAVKVVVLVIVLFLFSKFLLQKITNYFAKSQEALLLFTLAWCLFVATLFKISGFSVEIGALLAGVTLSLSDYKVEIASKVKPIRDFFLVLFFIHLGANMSFSSIEGLILPIIVFSIFVLIGNPLIVLVLMGSLGFTKRTGFLAGLTVAQISEFSLILVALGIASGHLPQNVLSVVTVVGIITIAISSYMIIYSNNLYNLLSKYLNIFEFRKTNVEKSDSNNNNAEIILFGYNRIGFDILNTLNKLNKKYLVVDYNPSVIKDLKKRNINCIYGDADDIEFLEEIDISQVSMVISTIPVIETNKLLINVFKNKNPKTITLVVSHRIDESLMLYSHGASYVIMPHFLGGLHTASLLEKFQLEHELYLNEQEKHKSYLEQRKKEGYEHPTYERGEFYRRLN